MGGSQVCEPVSTASLLLMTVGSIVLLDASLLLLFEFCCNWERMKGIQILGYRSCFCPYYPPLGHSVRATAWLLQLLPFQLKHWQVLKCICGHHPLSPAILPPHLIEILLTSDIPMYASPRHVYVWRKETLLVYCCLTYCNFKRRKYKGLPNDSWCLYHLHFIFKVSLSNAKILNDILANKI